MVDYTETERPPPATLLRVHQGQTTQKHTGLPLELFSGYPGGRLHRNRQASPWDPSQGTTRGHADYTETDRPPPWALLSVHQVADYTKTYRPSPGILLRVSRGQITQKQTTLPLGPFSGDRLHRNGQASPWDSSQGTPGDRLQTGLPLKPFSGYTRGQTTQKQTGLPLGPFSGYTRGQTTQKHTGLPGPRNMLLELTLKFKNIKGSCTTTSKCRLINYAYFRPHQRTSRSEFWLNSYNI